MIQTSNALRIARPYSEIDTIFAVEDKGEEIKYAKPVQCQRAYIVLTSQQIVQLVPEDMQCLSYQQNLLTNSVSSPDICFGNIQCFTVFSGQQMNEDRVVVIDEIDGNYSVCTWVQQQQ